MRKWRHKFYEEAKNTIATQSHRYHDMTIMALFTPKALRFAPVRAIALLIVILLCIAPIAALADLCFSHTPTLPQSASADHGADFNHDAHCDFLNVPACSDGCHPFEDAVKRHKDATWVLDTWPVYRPWFTVAMLGTEVSIALLQTDLLEAREFPSVCTVNCSFLE